MYKKIKQLSTTDKTISLVLPLKNESLNDLKQKLKKEYSSKYSDPAHITLAELPVIPEKASEGVTAVIKLLKEKYTGDDNIFTETIFDRAELNYYPEKKFISIDFDKSPKLAQLHKDVIDTLEEFRGDRIRIQDQKSVKDLDKQERIQILKYGYHRTLDMYIPHITLGNFSEETDIGEIKKFFADLQLAYPVIINSLEFKQTTELEIRVKQYQAKQKRSKVITVDKIDIS